MLGPSEQGCWQHGRACEEALAQGGTQGLRGEHLRLVGRAPSGKQARLKDAWPEGLE